jgi:hypothetical protein
MVMVVMVMVVVMVASRSDHDPRDNPAIGVVVVMMMVVVITTHHDQLRHFDIRWRRGTGFVNSLQQRRGVRDRLQQVGEGIRPQDVARGRTRRSLGRA